MHSMSETVIEDFRSGQAKLVGWTMILNTCFLVISNVIGIQLQEDRSNYNFLFYVGLGFWAAPCFALAGGHALGAARVRTRGMISANLVLSTISLFVSTATMCVCVEGVKAERDAQYMSLIMHRATKTMAAALLISAVLQVVCSLWLIGLFMIALWCRMSKKAVEPSDMDGYGER